MSHIPAGKKPCALPDIAGKGVSAGKTTAGFSCKFNKTPPTAGQSARRSAAHQKAASPVPLGRKPSGADFGRKRRNSPSGGAFRQRREAQR